MGPFIPCRKEEVQGSCPEACLLLYFFLRVRRSVEEGRWSANERACVLRFLREFGTAFLGNRSPAFDAYLRQRIRSEDRLCWRAEREAALRLKKTEEEFLKHSRVARIATADERGMPHVVPVCHLWERGYVYFGTARESKKVHNLERNSQIALHRRLGALAGSAAARACTTDQPRSAISAHPQTALSKISAV